MKRTLLLSVITATLLSSFSVISDSWKTNVEDAKKEAAKANKHILLSFQGSDWCGNCMKLEKLLFESEEFKTFASTDLVLLKADFPMRRQNKLPKDQQEHNDQLAEKFNKKGSFPMVVILDSQGNLAGEMAYPLESPKAYIDNIKSIIN